MLFGYSATGASYANAIGILFLAMWTIEVLRRGATVSVPGSIRSLALFGGVLCLSVVAIDGANATRLPSALAVIAMSVLAVDVISRTGSIAAVEVGFYAGSCASYVAFLYQGPSVNLAAGDRFGGVFEQSNIMGHALSIAIAFAVRRIILSLWPEVRCQRQVLTAIAATTMVGFSGFQLVALSGSRGGTIVGALACLFLPAFVILSPRVSWSARALACFITPLVAVWVYNAAQHSATANRLESLVRFFDGRSVDEVSMGLRSEMIRLGLELWAERPVLGWGMDSFRAISDHQTYAHNNYVEILATTGSIGFVSYYCAYGSLLVALIAARRFFRMGWEAYWGLLVLCLSCINDAVAVTYYSKAHWLALAAIVGLVTHYRSRLMPVS